MTGHEGSVSDTDLHLLYPKKETVAQYCTGFPVTQAVRRRPDFNINKKKKRARYFVYFCPFQMTCRRNRLQCRVAGTRHRFSHQRGSGSRSSFHEITRIRNPECSLAVRGYLTYFPVSNDIHVGSVSDTDLHLLNPNTEIVAQYCTKEKNEKFIAGCSLLKGKG